MAQQQAKTQTRERQGQAARPPAADPKTTTIDLYKAQPVKTVTALLEDQLHKIAALIPSQLDPKRFGRLAVALIQKKGDLQKCTARSLLVSIAEAAALGLELDPQLGHGYLVPYWDKHSQTFLAQLIVGYRGFIHLLHETGRVRAVWPRPVYEGDYFDMLQGDDEYIKHRPVSPSERGRDQDGACILKGCYAIVKFVDGSHRQQWMWKEDIDARRARSKSPDAGPWVTDYIAMALKCPIREITKTSDPSPKLTKAAVADEMREVGLDVDLCDFSASELVGARTDATTKRLEEKYSGGPGGDPKPEGDQKTGAQAGATAAKVGGEPEEKPPLLPGDEGYVPPTGEGAQGELLGGRAPGQEG